MEKLTDNEIIKALEICNAESGSCIGCSLRKLDGCVKQLQISVLDLINRQKAEIESLKQSAEELDKANLQLMAILQTAQSEARKEFVERFKTKLSNLEYRDENPNMKQKGEWILHEAIPIAVDKVLKEMEGD